MSYLKNVIILCGTNNICTDSPYDIAQCLLDIGVYFQNHSSKIKIFISGILPRDACHSLNSMLIKEINTILKCKCALHSFNFVEEEQGWTDNINTLDPSLFYHDKLYVIQKAIRNIKLSESIITATEDRNIGENTPFNKMSNKKHNQFIKTYKMDAPFKLNHADFPLLLNSTVSKPVSCVSSSVSFTTASSSFSNKVRAISFQSVTKASNKPLSWNFAPKHLHNPSQSLAFDLVCNVPIKCKHYVICKAVVSFEPVAVNVNFAHVSVCQCVNVVRSVFCHPHVFF